MGKKVLKEKKLKEQEFKDGLTGGKIDAKIETWRVDTHRKKHKKDGGDYSNENYLVTNPVAHMKEHGTFKKRTPDMEKLKAMLDARKPIAKLGIASQNRLRSYKRYTYIIDERTIEWLEKVNKDVVGNEVKKRDKEIAKYMKTLTHSFIKPALGIKGVGPVLLSYLLVYINIKEARYASSLWSYVGYDKPSHKRYTKGESGGGNKNLRSAMFVLAGSFLKQKESPYKDIYYAEKQKLENSEKSTTSRPRTGGEMKKMKWKDTMPMHRHQAAIRKMMKHFLADVWKVWRTVEGLDTPILYPEAKLGHKGIVQPEERGWVYGEPKNPNSEDLIAL